jgi:hypothetical protein
LVSERERGGEKRRACKMIDTTEAKRTQRACARQQKEIEREGERKKRERSRNEVLYEQKTIRAQRKGEIVMFL